MRKYSWLAVKASQSRLNTRHSQGKILLEKVPLVMRDRQNHLKNVSSFRSVTREVIGPQHAPYMISSGFVVGFKDTDSFYSTHENLDLKMSVSVACQYDKLGMRLTSQV